MSTIDFLAVRRAVPVLRALDLLHWRVDHCWGEETRGSCPKGHTRKGAKRLLWTRGEGWYCHGCRRGGDVIDLWAWVRGLDYRAAALDLCREAGQQVPYAVRPARPPRPPRNRGEEG